MSPVSTVIGGCTIPVFSGPTQPGRPSIGRCIEYRQWLRPPLGKKRQVLCSSGFCDLDCCHAD